MRGTAFTLDLPDDAVERIAQIVEQRVAQRIVEQISPWMTLPQLCEYINAPKSRVYKLTSTRELPHYKEGNRLLFHRAEIDEYICGKTVAQRRQGN